jgi:hypothetical protein
MNWYILVCTGMYHNHGSMYKYEQVHAGMFWYLVCAGMYWYILAGHSIYRYVPVHTHSPVSMKQYVLVCTSMYQYILVHTIISPNFQHSYSLISRLGKFPTH